MKKRCYISGAISSDKNYKAKFRIKELELEHFYEVISPAYLEDEGKTYTDLICEALKLQETCSVTYFLRDYDISDGAQMELIHSRVLKQETFFEKAKSLQDIFEHVCKVEKITGKQLRGRLRTKHIKEARHLFCYLARTRTTNTIVEIGNMVNRHHANVIHAVKYCKNEFDFEIQKKLQRYE
jgi:hypothetical protein